MHRLKSETLAKKSRILRGFFRANGRLYLAYSGFCHYNDMVTQ